jgi:RNA polymerase sigma factor (sigma-70 family)
MTDDPKDPCHTRETLLERIRNRHDDDSWEDFVFYYKQYIYIICRRMGLNHHDGEEIVQKVMLKIWDKLPTFEYDKKKRFRGWLCLVTGNTVKDFFRSYKRAQDRKEKAADYEIWNPESSSQPEIEKMAEKEWENYIANMALDNIRGKFSDKVIECFMRVSEGTPVKDVSADMDVPLNTVYVYNKRVSNKYYEEIRRLYHELN